MNTINENKEKIQDALKIFENIEQETLNIISPQFQEIYLSFKEDSERVLKEITDNEKLENAKITVKNFENIFVRSIKAILSNALLRKNAFFKYVNVVEWTNNVYNEIEKHFKDAKLECNQKTVENINKLSIESVRKVTECGLEAIDKIPIIPKETFDIKNLLRKVVHKQLMTFYKCPYEDGILCFDEISKNLEDYTNEISSIKEKFNQNGESSVAFTVDSSKRCIETQRNQFLFGFENFARDC